MKVAVFDTHNFERDVLNKASQEVNQELTFFEMRLTEETAMLAKGHKCVCAFTNDHLKKEVLLILKNEGVELIALRSAGFNHVDLISAKALGLKVVRVPEYSPYSVAEYAVGLILCLNRKIHKAYNRVREGNFLLDGLVGFDLHGKTVGVIGTGKIGKAFIKIMRGFGCKVIAYDKIPDEQFALDTGCLYKTFEEVISNSDVISLHVPLTKDTLHLFSKNEFALLKKNCILINTGRGGLIHTQELMSALKRGDLGGAGLDVYEEEENFFFQDHSEQVLQDDVLSRLMTFPNVILTSHQAFLTSDALKNIAETTMESISAFENGLELKHQL